MILLESGVEVNPRDHKGNTPLHFCCNNGHMDSATLLMIVRFSSMSLAVKLKLKILQYIIILHFTVAAWSRRYCS